MSVPSETIPMILTCPACNGRHIDQGDFATKLHHTHACQHCGLVWRPAIVNTVGVQFLPGFFGSNVSTHDEPEKMVRWDVKFSHEDMAKIKHKFAEELQIQGFEMSKTKHKFELHEMYPDTCKICGGMESYSVHDPIAVPPNPEKPGTVEGEFYYGNIHSPAPTHRWSGTWWNKLP